MSTYFCWVTTLCSEWFGRNDKWLSIWHFEAKQLPERIEFHFFSSSNGGWRTSDKWLSSLRQLKLKETEGKCVWQWCLLKEYNCPGSRLFLSSSLSAILPGEPLSFSSTIFYPRELIGHTASITQVICDVVMKKSLLTLMSKSIVVKGFQNTGERPEVLNEVWI